MQFQALFSLWGNFLLLFMSLINIHIHWINNCWLGIFWWRDTGWNHFIWINALIGWTRIIDHLRLMTLTPFITVSSNQVLCLFLLARNLTVSWCLFSCCVWFLWGELTWRRNFRCFKLFLGTAFEAGLISGFKTSHRIYSSLFWLRLSWQWCRGRLCQQHLGRSPSLPLFDAFTQIRRIITVLTVLQVWKTTPFFTGWCFLTLGSTRTWNVVDSFDLLHCL